jgi:RNA polymerase sigma-70 factor (ECF subfamily)
MTTVEEAVDLAALVAGAKAGRTADMECLVARLRPAIYRYCLSRLLVPQDAEDVTQEVTIAMLSAVPRYVDQGRPFMSFVMGIAANKVAEARRVHARRREIVPGEIPEQVCRADGPETVAVRLETTRELAQLLHRLTEREAEILRLRIAAGLSAEETGAVLSISANAVRVTQHRALGKLRGLIPRPRA